MKEQEMIEEMAKDLNSSIAIMTTESFSDCLDIAKFLVDLDYGKIDKNSVVLSKEEYEKEKLKLFAKAYNQASKETAEKFAKRVYERLSRFYQYDLDWKIPNNEVKTLLEEIKQEVLR